MSPPPLSLEQLRLAADVTKQTTASINFDNVCDDGDDEAEGPDGRWWQVCWAAGDVDPFVNPPPWLASKMQVDVAVALDEAVHHRRGNPCLNAQSMQSAHGDSLRQLCGIALAKLRHPSEHMRGGEMVGPSSSSSSIWI